MSFQLDCDECGRSLDFDESSQETHFCIECETEMCYNCYEEHRLKNDTHEIVNLSYTRHEIKPQKIKPAEKFELITMTHDSWESEGVRRFGKIKNDWKFVCPACGFVQSVKMCLEAGMEESAIGYSCIGRFWGSGTPKAFGGDSVPCNYAGGGLFRLQPLRITKEGKIHELFAFANENKV